MPCDTPRVAIEQPAVHETLSHHIIVPFLFNNLSTDLKIVSPSANEPFQSNQSKRGVGGGCPATPPSHSLLPTLSVSSSSLISRGHNTRRFHLLPLLQPHPCPSIHPAPPLNRNCHCHTVIGLVVNKPRFVVEKGTCSSYTDRNTPRTHFFPHQPATNQITRPP